MPHDINNRCVHVGDLVTVDFRVINLCEGEDYCNVTLETLFTMPPENKYKTQLSNINTKMIRKVYE